VIEPAVVVTVYNDLRGVRALPILDALARDAAPGDLAVCIHDPPSGDDRALADAVCARGLRLWYGWGVDPDAARAEADAAQRTRDRAALARDRGAEVVELNGEARWRGMPSGRATSLIDAARTAGLPVSWTSFDHLGYHALPWSAILGPGGVDRHAPQLYGASPGATPSGHTSVRARIAKAEGQMRAFVGRGVVRPELGPGGDGYDAYGQLHGMTPAGAAVVFDRTDIARAWAIPTRHDAAGLLGLRAVLMCRARAGRSGGAVARWQASVGLTADGVVGPVTLRALGLAP